MNHADVLTVLTEFLSPAPAVHGGGDAGIVGLVDQVIDKIMALVESGAGWSLFPGIRALALNIHPMIVHFPIAFLSAFFLIELYGVVRGRSEVRVAASWMLYLGAASAIAAVVAGLVAAANVPHGALVHETMEWHERIMLGVAGLALTLAAWRAMVSGQFETPMAQGLHLFMASLMIALMLVGTDLGGLMVYQHGVGVASLQSIQDSHQHAHAAPEEQGTSPSVPAAALVGERH